MLGNPVNPKCIDPMLATRQRSFQNLCVIEAGLSDFQKMAVTVVKSCFQNLELKIISYTDFKLFSND